MSAWRSPLLYLGFVLIVIAAAALLAPLFVDWNSYRSQFEDHGRKLTGRDVTITGGIEARLFPWPAMVLNQVRIANREGTRRAYLMEAGRIEIGMSLAPLISGHVEVDSITIDEPVFAFERLATGAASWTIEPEHSLAALIDPDRVAVSEVSIYNGTVLMIDHRRGDVDRIEEFDGTLSAPALSGPWRMRATASYNGSPFDIILTTGKLNPGQAARVGLRIAPAEGAGMVYSFDGEVARPTGKSVKGALKITPTLSPRGKGDAETGLRPFRVKADVEADFESVALTKIEASPAFSTDPGNFITGAATIDLGSRVEVRTALVVARLDLDHIAGRRGREAVQSATAFEELAHLLRTVPQWLEVHVDLAASSVIVGGETLDASRLALQLGPERMRIEEFATTMPGQTRARFSGLVVLSENEPLISGDVRFDSVSLRDFVVWAVPEERQDIEQIWSGMRGRLGLEAKLDLTPRDLRLSNVRTTLDDATIAGSLSVQHQPQSAVALRIDADRIDLDRYMPRGPGEWAGGSGLAVTLAELVGEAMTLGDFKLTVQAGQLRLRGVEAQDIAIDIGANEHGIELRTVEIGRVGAARMVVAGLLRFPGDGVAGSINAVIDAKDPRGLLRLLGAFGSDGEAEPAWAQALGPLDVRLVAEASAEERITTAAMALTGAAGGASATVEGRFRGESANWQEAEIEFAVEMDAPSSALVGAITGLRLPLGVDKASSLAGSLAGSLSGGLATSVNAELFGAQGQFVGTIRHGRAGLEAEGRAAVLAQQAAGWFALVGVPADSLSPLAQVLAAESKVRYDGRGLRLSELSGTAGGTSFSADLTAAFEPVQRLSGEITTLSLSLPWLLGTVLLPRDGTAHTLSSHFASALPGLEADLTIAADRLEVLPGMALESSELDFKVGRFDLSLQGRGTGPGGEPATGRLDLQLDRRGVTLDGAMQGPVALGDLLRASDGSQVIEGDGHVRLDFSGSGRSPAGVLAALRADGSYDLPRGVLRQVDPQTFARDLAAATQPADIDGLFTGSLRSGDMAFVGGSGSIKLAEGVLWAKPLAILGQGITGEARFVLEAASGEIDLSFTLDLTGPEDIPTFELAYAGPPGALESSTDAQTLRSYLSMRMLQDGVRRLEELQRQERELIEEDEKFRREQLRREQLRREQQQRDTLRMLDRKERELAVRRQVEQQEAEERLAQEGLAKEQAALERLAEEAVGEDVIERLAEEAARQDAIERQAVPAAEPEPAAVQPNAVTVLPLDSPAADGGDALASPLDPGGVLVDPVPLPQFKPQSRPAAGYDASIDPLQLPRDGYLGRMSEPVFSDPTIVQPELARPHPAATATESSR